MKIMQMPRRTWKTSAMIMLSLQNNMPIICLTDGGKKNMLEIVKKNKYFDKQTPIIYTVDEIKSWYYKGKGHHLFVVDDVDRILTHLLWVDISYGSLTMDDNNYILSPKKKIWKQ